VQGCTNRPTQLVLGKLKNQFNIKLKKGSWKDIVERFAIGLAVHCF
jgi:uncharacterized protein YlxP (DUF503 family)